MRSDNRIHILNDITSGDNLFSLPATINEALVVINDPNASIEQLANSVNKDPGLASTILRVANSPFYHRVSEVRSLSDAVMTLGDMSVKTIALTATVMNPQHIKDASGVDPIEFVSNSIEVATLARELSILTGKGKPEDALLAGMLADLGLLYFMGRLGERYGEVVIRCRDGENLIAVERDVFGIDHAEVGFEMAKAWNLPYDLALCIGSHHGEQLDRDSKERCELVDVVRLAALTTSDRYLHYARDAKCDFIDEREMQNNLGIRDDELLEVVDRARTEARELAERFGVSMSNSEDVLNRANRKLGNMLVALERTLAERDELDRTCVAKEKQELLMGARIQAITELSHHINNSSAVIIGRTETLQLTLEDCLIPDRVADARSQLDEIRAAVEKINSTLAEMSSVRSCDEIEKLASQVRNLTTTQRSKTVSD